EDAQFFEACLPVEEIARRGRDALRYGPLKPLGLPDPRTGDIPFGVVQLRQDNAAATLYNLVGFQTNLKWGEQARVFQLIPGLEQAEFVRYGVMHRNTFINAPTLLLPTMQFRARAELFFGGQITGTEGYMESTASGCLAGINAARHLLGQPLLELPEATMIGALCHYVATAEPKRFQPMKANFGILPPLEKRLDKRRRYAAYSQRALLALDEYIASN
ncbi:MAG: methylenetetrahydrofolate--tRNA-(uracil(54)-C(5))-methyltransferase (FADH(2)-oxidizing) TrmFO, partial [Chloroflexi bacterium]|nr:methylenetetrahydrofolate--tRNA-(uracil(54)-C(5))-methyltransferase (FADH(2)-oxidizing) TrmFO [Chloroflexota bacterium]